MTQINLLPWREQNRKIQNIRFAIMLASFIIVTLFFIIFLHIIFHNAIHTQQKRNTYLQSLLDEEHNEIILLNKNEREENRIDTELNLISSLQKSNYQVVQALNELVKVVPNTVILNKLIIKKNKITLFGKAQSDLQITFFMKNIDKSSVFKQPVLSEINSTNPEKHTELSFQLTVEQEE